MPDRRRHSVEIPLSKALMNLKRVRSLRDPSTVSMRKFPTTVNYINWDSISCNTGSSQQHRTRYLCSDGKGEKDLTIDSDSDSGNSCKNYDHALKSFGVSSSKPRKYGECRRRKPNGLYEDGVGDSYGEASMDPAKKVNSVVLRKKTGYRGGNLRKLSAAIDASPSMTCSEAQTNRSSNGFSIFRNEDGDVAGSTYSGCGLSSCWSVTPKLKDRHRYSHLEEQEQHPLLSAADMTDPTYREMTLCLDSPRSLSQKYRPKSFDELAGQHVVAQSLMNAISKGKISPIYVFHGPRGTGKTCMARVFAAALNCLSLEAYRPCGFCRECVFLFSGKSRDVKELDGSKLNRKDRVKSLLKSSSHATYSSSFKIFIIDECEFLQEQAWSTILNSLEEIPRRVIFIMVTSEFDKLPCNSVSRCQRYHFPKIKDTDIVCRLQRICVDEVLEFDKEALDCIAGKSNGSLRDAEIMLDQLSLLGKKITAALAYELIGIVSDDELIGLLNLALSSDTSSTVRRARELMSSKVDPMQLVSQLANLIMDILSGRCQSGFSDAARIFFARHALTEASLQRLRHALKILSDTEKQLRTTKNQATWLTAALLQLCSEESFSMTDADDPKMFLKTGSCLRDDGLCCTAKETREGGHRNSNVPGNLKFPVGHCDCSRKLEIIWRRSAEKCQTNSLRTCLLKEGKLTSIYVGQGVAIAEIHFFNPDHVSKAEKSWKQIASSLQCVLGCNVEIRIDLSPFRKTTRSRKSSFRFLSCSDRRQEISESEMETSTRKEGSVQTYSDDHGQYLSPLTQLSDSKLLDGVTIRDTEGNALSSGGVPMSKRHFYPTKGYNMCSDGSSNDNHKEHKYSIIQDSPHYQPCCFPKIRNLQPKLPLTTNGVSTIQLGMEQNNKSEASVPKNASLETCLCLKKSCVFCTKSDAQTDSYSSVDDDLSPRNRNNGSRSSWHCWGAPKSSINKAWEHMQQHPRRCVSVGWVLPCLSGKQMPQA